MENSLSTTHEVVILIRPEDQIDSQWQIFDRGPGIFHIPAGMEAGVRIQHINDDTLRQLVQDLLPCLSVHFLDLSENRKVTDQGIEHVGRFTQLTSLNLSSCDITKVALGYLKTLPRLQYLNLSYCNRINQYSVPALRALTHLTYLDLQGTVKLNTAALTHLQRRGLKIHK
jgi:Leucine-rich repeat (LRR) protein